MELLCGHLYHRRLFPELLESLLACWHVARHGASTRTSGDSLREEMFQPLEQVPGSPGTVPAVVLG